MLFLHFSFTSVCGVLHRLRGKTKEKRRRKVWVSCKQSLLTFLMASLVRLMEIWNFPAKSWISFLAKCLHAVCYVPCCFSASEAAQLEVAMKQQKSEQKPGKLQNLIAEFGVRGITLLKSSNKKPLWMPDLKETGGKRRLRRNSDEFRRKTRSQALREKKVKAVLSSVEFSEVSIETLHSICAPAVSQQASNPYLKKLACLIRR